MKRFGLMSLAEISRKPSVDCVMWLSVITVIQIYNKNKQTGGKQETQNVQFEEKKSLRKFNVRGKTYALRDEKFKGIIQNGKMPTQVSFCLVKTEMPKQSFASKAKKANQQRRTSTN